MKSNVWKYAAALMACIAAISSCKKPAPEKTEPVFPTDVINKTVAPGESVNISIEPNMAWVATISGEGSGNYFWIDDAGMKATSVSGKAGSALITVVFSEDEEFDKNRVCDVTLTMDVQSKKIATLTRPSLNRSFEAYAGVAGEFDFTEDFGAEAVTEASLVTFPGVAEYSLPVRIVTNYSWDIVLPSWLSAKNVADGEQTVSGGPGTADILLSAVLSEDILNGTEGVVKFIDRNNTGASNEVKIVLPDFSSRVEVDVNSMEFNKIGQVLMPNGSYVDGTAVAYVLAAKGMTMKAVEWLGDYHDTKYADWVEFGYGEYDETAGPLQVVDVTIGVAENPGAQRYADIFAFPVSMGEVNAEDICDFNDPSCGFNAEYEKYYVGRLVQDGDKASYITPISSEEMRAEVGTYFSTLEPKGEDNILQWDFPDAGSYSKIVYTTDYSYEEASFNCAEPFAYVKLFADTDYPNGLFSQEVTEADNCWISFAAFGGENKQGRFNMNYTPDAPTHTAAVFYNENDEILAAVLVVYDPAYTGDTSDFMFNVASGVAKISKMDKNSELYTVINGNYNVTEVYEILTNDRMLYVTGQKEFWSALAIDPATFNDYSGKISVEGASPNFYVYTNACTGLDEVVVIFQELASDGVSMVNFAAVHITYDPNAEIEADAPFEFVYPEYVGGMATLEKHTGEYVDLIVADWGASQAPKHIYLLTYTDPSASSVAVVKVPGKPMGGAAFNNYDPNTGNEIEGYWLTHEQDGDQMTIFMEEAGKVDYFLFTDPTGLPSCALVCTMVLP